MTEVFQKVQQAFTEAFRIDPWSVSLDTGPDDIAAWDSIGHLKLASCLDRIFGISLDVDELMEMENVREIVRVIESKTRT